MRGPQVGDGAQVLKAVPLFLQRIGRVAQADHLHGVGLQLEGLLHARRQRQRTGRADGAAQRDFQRFGKVLRLPVLQHDLQVFKARAVVELDKAERLASRARCAPSRRSRKSVRSPHRAVVCISRIGICVIALSPPCVCLASIAAPMNPAFAPSVAILMSGVGDFGKRKIARDVFVHGVQQEIAGLGQCRRPARSPRGRKGDDRGQREA